MTLLNLELFTFTAELQKQRGTLICVEFLV